MKLEQKDMTQRTPTEQFFSQTDVNIWNSGRLTEDEIARRQAAQKQKCEAVLSEENQDKNKSSLE